MALGSKAPTSFKHSTAAILLLVYVTLTQSAPTTYDEIEARRTDLTNYFNDPNGCYYNYQHYEEGDRIITNEPCLNCTCHNRMLMCYLRVCPFSKAIGQDCTVQKSPDQCCPTISCPEVPVHLLTSSTTQQPTTTTTTTTTTEVGWRDNYGCMMNDKEFYPDGAQVPSDLKKPCELCYCIRNRTACVMQECTLHVEGCRPVYREGVCCPVRYDCDYENEKSTTTTPQISGGLVFSTTSAPFDCRVNDEVYRDGESIAMVSEKPCQHCYCMRGDIVCAVQDCGEPLRGKHCTPETPPAGQCCPTSYQCANETIISDDITTIQPASQSDTDENEAEKYPSNEDIYDKLGEHQPSQDDTNDVNSDNTYTTPAYNNEISSVDTSDQTTNKNEEIKNSADDNHSVVEKPNILPASDNVNKINDENKQEISSDKPELTSQVNNVDTESHQTQYESTDKPVEPTLIDEALPTVSISDDTPLHENIVNPTTQTTPSENNNVKINEENNNNKSPVENTSQNDPISNAPVVTTEHSLESETQSSNINDNPQEGIQQQTDIPSIIEKEPIKSNNDEQQIPEQHEDTKLQTETTFNENQEPIKQNNEENTDSATEENKIQTGAPLSEDTEQTTQILTQHDNKKSPLEQSNTQTETSSNNGQNSLDGNNEDVTQLPQEENSSNTENPSEQNVPNDNKPQAENESSTEISKVENEPTEQNNIPVDGKPHVENQPESQNKPIELNQDSLQENASPTEIPKIENETTEQNNNIPVENKPQNENQPESQNAPTEQNQDSLHEENISTERPNIENEPTELNNLPVNGKPQAEIQPESQTKPIESNQDSLQENASPTEIPKVENEPTEQNNHIPVENKPQNENQSESQSKPIELNQDSLQGNASPTEIPKIENEPTGQNNNMPVENKPQNENQPESQNVPTEQNQDSLQENISPTEISKVDNVPTEQNNLLVENKPESQNSTVEQNQSNLPIENQSSTEIPKVENEPVENDQDGPSVENESSTVIPKVENEPTEQNNTPVENKPQTENQPESQNIPTEQNQDSLQENVSPTEIPKVENELNENNQDSPPVENASSTEIPKIENEPTEQNNIPVENKPQTENQPEFQNVPTEQNQDSLQENVLPTEISQAENEPTGQNNNMPVENKPQTENKSEFQNTSTEKNQDSLQENLSPTEISQVENEPTEQNNIPEENKPLTGNQPESQNAPTEQNQNNSQENESSTEIPKIENEQNNLPVDNKPQTEIQPESQNITVEQNQNKGNVLSTEIPKVENETIEPNKPTLESSTQTVTQPESDKIPVEQNNQDTSQVDNVSSTVIPSKLNEQQSQNITPTAPMILQNDVSTEQPIEDNNIFVVSPTSPPLFSQNQVKGEESTSVPNDNNNNDEYSSTEKNVGTIIENSPPSVDDKTSPADNINLDNISTITSTEVILENNGSPQTNDENTEQSTETKLVENEVNNNIPNDVSNSPVNSNEQTPTNVEHNDNRFGSNEPDNGKPTFTPTTETSYEVDSETTNQSILVDDSSSQENEQDNEHSVDKENQSIPDADSIEHQSASQTETPTEIGTSENGNPSTADEHITTSLPQQQEADNNTPVKSEEVNSSEHTTTQDDTKTPNLSENNTPEKSSDNQLSTETSEIQHSDKISNPTESSVLSSSDLEQFTTTHPTKQTNEQTLNENVNEILDQTSVSPDILSDDKNKFNTAESNQNNEENVTPLSDKINGNTSAQDVDKKPFENSNKDVSIETESTTILQTEQINHESSENADNVDNLVTTNSYSEIPSVVIPNKDVPLSQEGGNEVSPSPANPPNNIETNNQPTNGIPQQSVNPDETSTQYTIDDGSTNIPIQESPNTNVNENAETSTNVPSNSGIPNTINQDSITESELYPTQSPTEKNILTFDLTKAPDNEATIEIITNRPEYINNSEISANEVIDEKSSESPQNANAQQQSTSQTTDYIIDITTTKPSEPLNNVPGSIKTENEVNDVNTYNVDKNNEMTTQLYENIQPGVPGEGSCLINFVTYAHKAEVPKSNPCHEKCECLNSIVTCTSVNCPPAPPQHRNCIPLHPGNESWCCPTYMCEGGIEGMLFEGNNQLGSPQLISTVVLEDKPGEENDEKTTINEEAQSTSNPQIALEHSTLAPSNSDTNSDVNSQDIIGVTEISTQTEIPNKQMEDSVVTNGENIIPVTISNQDTTVNENDKPEESDHLSENDKLDNTSEKPIENESSEGENPVENDKLQENNEPIENNQSAENEKPIDSSEGDFTTISHEDNLQTFTNKPETLNNIENKNASSNSANESQNYPAPSTEIPNYESTITNVLPTNDQNQPQSNSESEDTITATTFKPNESVAEQQVDDNKSESNEPTINEESNTSPVNYVTDLPESNVNPLEITHTPTIVDDTIPMLNENNANGLRPSSIDDIISSVNMVKDAVKNSLETSSKPIENDYETTEMIVNQQPTILPEGSASPPSEDSMPNRFNEPQTTVISTNIASELQTDEVDEKLTENSTTVQSSNEIGVTEVATSSPSVNSDQGLSTVLPQYIPIKQDIPASTSTSNGDINQPGEIVNDKTPEITTTKYLPNPVEQDLTSNGPETSSDSIAPQVNFESNTNMPETVVNDKSPEITTQALPSVTQQEILKNDMANKPAEDEKPNTEIPISPDSNVNNDNAPAEVVSPQVVTSHSTTEFPNTGTTDGNDKRFGEPSSSPTPSKPLYQEHNKPPQESGEMVNIPFDTEKPLPKPSSSTPLTPQKPSYTPIPQSTWTQKPFHHDSTSEPPQPDQSFTDDYDDENEAVYGPGTCRYGGKIYVSAQQVPRDDPCDFCFCFRGDIICLQQSCPPPIFGCYQENINGFCCPRYECPVAQATSVNVTTTTTTTTTMVPPHFFANAYRGAARRTGCLIHGHAYRVGEDVGIASGPCLECICGADGKMKCDPKSCSPEPLLRKMMVEAVDDQRRR